MLRTHTGSSSPSFTSGSPATSLEQSPRASGGPSPQFRAGSSPASRRGSSALPLCNACGAAVSTPSPVLAPPPPVSTSPDKSARDGEGWTRPPTASPGHMRQLAGTHNLSPRTRRVVKEGGTLLVAAEPFNLRRKSHWTGAAVGGGGGGGASCAWDAHASRRSEGDASDFMEAAPEVLRSAAAGAFGGFPARHADDAAPAAPPPPASRRRTLARPKTAGQPPTALDGTATVAEPAAAGSAASPSRAAAAPRLSPPARSPGGGAAAALEIMPTPPAAPSPAARRPRGSASTSSRPAAVDVAGSSDDDADAEPAAAPAVPAAQAAQAELAAARQQLRGAAAARDELQERLRLCEEELSARQGVLTSLQLENNRLQVQLDDRAAAASLVELKLSAALKAIQTLENAWADDASGADGDARRRPVAAVMEAWEARVAEVMAENDELRRKCGMPARRS